MRNQAAPFASRTHITIISYASGQKRLLRHVGGTEINSGIIPAIGIIQFDSRMQLSRGCPLLMLWTTPPPVRECHSGRTVVSTD
jgi:hypothetical protein